MARIIGRIYKEIGVLKSGHTVEVSRGDLVAEFIGHTEPKVKEVVNKALDGVLFIDEAYMLAPADNPRDFGYDAINELLAHMENHRGRLVVIVAGYAEEMERFIGANPGLASRFNEQNFIEFEDYKPPELVYIYDGCAPRPAAPCRWTRSSRPRG